MKFSALEVEKADISLLDTDELRQLVDVASHPGFDCLRRLAEDAIQKQLETSISSTDMTDLERTKYLSNASFMREAWEFLFDATERARSELSSKKKS